MGLLICSIGIILFFTLISSINGISFCNQSKTTSLHRYYHAGLKNHYYTINSEELEDGKDGWVYEGVAGRCYEMPEDETVPLYRYSRPTLGEEDHFYTQNWSELGPGKYGYKFDLIACYISPIPRAGTLPFYRYHSPSKHDHLYTTDFSELREGADSYVIEGITGYLCSS